MCLRQTMSPRSLLVIPTWIAWIFIIGTRGYLKEGLKGQWHFSCFNPTTPQKYISADDISFCASSADCYDDTLSDQLSSALDRATILQNPDIQRLIQLGGDIYNVISDEMLRNTIELTERLSAKEHLLDQWVTYCAMLQSQNPLEDFEYPETPTCAEDNAPLHLLSREFSEPFQLSAHDKGAAQLLCGHVEDKASFMKKTTTMAEKFPKLQRTIAHPDDVNVFDPGYAKYWGYEHAKACETDWYGFRRPLCITLPQVKQLLQIVEAQRRGLLPQSSPGSIHTIEMIFERMTRWGVETSKRTVVCALVSLNDEETRLGATEVDKSMFI